MITSLVITGGPAMLVLLANPALVEWFQHHGWYGAILAVGLPALIRGAISYYNQPRIVQPQPQPTMKGGESNMSWSSILNMVFQLFGIYETDQALLEAGQPAPIPATRVGTCGGKPLYLVGTLTTTP